MLVQHLSHRAAVLDDGFDALGHDRRRQLIQDVLAGLTLLAGFRRPEAGHAAIHLEAATVAQHGSAWALLRPRQQAADHDRLGASREGLRQVTTAAEATISNDGNVSFFRRVDTIEQCRELRDPNAGDYAR